MDDDMTAGGVALRGVTRRYGHGATAVVALDDLSVTFETETFTAIMGPSGSGKSTLLQCAAGLDVVDEGSIEVDGTTLDELGEAGRARLRRDRIGFVFQSFNLVAALTAARNVALPRRRHRAPDARGGGRDDGATRALRGRRELVLGLAASTLRGRWTPLIGAFVALALGATIVIGAVQVILAVNGAVRVQPERYRAAPIVVTGQPSVRAVSGRGSDRDVESDPNPAQAGLSPRLVRRLAAAPGVHRVVVDRSFPVRLQSGGATVGPVFEKPLFFEDAEAAALAPAIDAVGVTPLRALPAVRSNADFRRAHGRRQNLTPREPQKIASTSRVTALALLFVDTTAHVARLS